VFLCIFAYALAVVIPNPGQSDSAAQKTLPSIDQILERSVSATGGREVWLKLTSMKSKGEVPMSPPALNQSPEFLREV